MMVNIVDMFGTWPHFWDERKLQPELSSNALQCTTGVAFVWWNPLSFNFWRSCIIGMASRKDCDKAIYSASVVLRDMQVCNLDTYSIGQATYLITKSVRDLRCSNHPVQWVDSSFQQSLHRRILQMIYSPSGPGSFLRLPFPEDIWLNVWRPWRVTPWDLRKN